jgi:hypothetical protein
MSSALNIIKNLNRESQGLFVTEVKISLEYHTELNPKLWTNWELKPAVRKKLLDFADAWSQFAKIPNKMIKDIIMIGGNTNYNYTAKSDIDVHIVIDRNALNPDRAFVDEYLQSKKVLWTLTHKISILGYPIEPYAQHFEGDYPKGQGVFSLKNNKWIQKPNHEQLDFNKDNNLKKKVMFYAHMIDDMIKYKMDLVVFNDLKKKIAEMRAASISKNGEFGEDNLIFKELRNRGYLDKMTKYETSIKDQELSLK